MGESPQTGSVRAGYGILNRRGSLESIVSTVEGAASGYLCDMRTDHAH